MADNYLGRKMEEYFARQNGGTAGRRPGATLGRLLLKNRSHRGYDSGFLVREDQLRRIIEVNTRIPSARNQQVLRFRPVLSDEAPRVLPHIRLGGRRPPLLPPRRGALRSQAHARGAAHRPAPHRGRRRARKVSGVEESEGRAIPKMLEPRKEQSMQQAAREDGRSRLSAAARTR